MATTGDCNLAIDKDVALWRRLTRLWVRFVARRRAVVVPMTVVRPELHDYLARDARVFTLLATRSTIAARIDGASDAHTWRRENLDRCLAAFEDEALGEHVDTTDRSPSEVAASIVDRLRTICAETPNRV